MIPDLGKYTVSVLGAYGITFALLGLLVAQSIWRARRMKARLGAAETRRTTEQERQNG